MEAFQIVAAKLADRQALADMFLGHISSHTEYISHGELQMGVGEETIVGGIVSVGVSPRARQMWMKYITEHIESKDLSAVYKAVDSTNGHILGFTVVEVAEDGSEPFGVVCDILVKDGVRCAGIGSALLEKGLAWLRSKGVVDIYLESGRENHAAHDWFRGKGFVHVSEIFKLSPLHGII